jgi:hypothetical protein
MVRSLTYEPEVKIFVTDCTGCRKIDACVKLKMVDEYYCKKCFDERNLKYENCLWDIIQKQKPGRPKKE